MDINNLLGFISQIGTFMIIFSLCFFVFRFILNLILKNKTINLFKKFYLCDILSVFISLTLIINCVKIHPAL